MPHPPGRSMFLARYKVVSPIVLVLVLDFLGRGKRTNCQQRSKIENEDDDEDEDDWGGKLYRAKDILGG